MSQDLVRIAVRPQPASGSRGPRRRAGAVLLRTVLGGVLLLAGVGKLSDLGLFAETVAAVGVLPNPIVNVFAITLPALEALCGALLLVGAWVRACAAIALALALGFAASLGWAWLRGDALMSCGCFGVLAFTDRLTLPLTVALDFGLSGVASALLWSSGLGALRPPGWDGVASPRDGSQGVAG